MYIKTKIFFAIFIFFVLVSLTCASAADNQTEGAVIESDALPDELSADISQDELLGDTDYSLQDILDEIINGQDEPIVYLQHQSYKYDSLKDQDYMVKYGVYIERSNFVIDGGGCTIDGSESSSSATRIFHLSGQHITVRNIHFINGIASDDRGCGGAIYSTYDCTLENCVFENNRNTSVFVQMNCTATGCTFNGNDGINGGAISSDRHLYLKECSFNRNTAVNGGAVCGINSTDLFNCTFTNNSAEYGGAVYADRRRDQENYVFSAELCNFNGNSAQGRGGAIHANCDDYNTASVSVKKCNFVENIASTENGGAISGNCENNKVVILSVVNCYFTGNSAKRGMGGAVYGNCSLKDSVFMNNSAKNGGAIGTSSDGIADVNIVNGTFYYNNADKGSAIFSESLSCANSTFCYNQAKSISLDVSNSNQDFTISFNGNDNYINAVYSNSNINWVNVTYWNGSYANTDIENPTKGSCSGVNITFEIHDSDDNIADKVTLLIDDSNKAYYHFNLPYDTYTYKAYLTDENYYTYIEKTGDYIYKAVSTINISQIGDIAYNTPFDVQWDGENLTRVNVTIYDSSNNEVYSIVFNPAFAGKTLKFPGLQAGTYNITATNQGNSSIWGCEDSKIFNVLNLTIVASANQYVVATKMAYQAKLTDEKGNPVSNKTVTFAVGGKTYTATTNDQGIASVVLNGLKVGNYDVVIRNDFASTVTKRITVLARIYENKNVVADYDFASYKVRVRGDDGRPVANAVVKFTVNGVTSSISTDKDGYATLKINLAPKTYVVTSAYKGYSVKNTIKVNPTLKAQKMFSVKKNAKKLILKATLKRSNGKAIAGKKIVFKFKGKKYTARTNKKGIAKVTIKKKVIKTLKVNKKYALKVSYKNEIVNSKVKVKK